MEKCSILLDGKIIIAKMTILPNPLYTFIEISTQIQATFFRDLEQSIIKFVWNLRRSQISKSNHSF